MKPTLPLTALLLSLAALAGCSDTVSAATPAPVQTAAATAPSTAPVNTRRPRLIFFMNPNGRPCQLQEAILRAMPDLPSRADVTFFRTTEPGELARFEQFGIRSLPQLVVTDQAGAELRRATPGIQSEAQVRLLLGY